MTEAEIQSNVLPEDERNDVINNADDDSDEDFHSTNESDDEYSSCKFVKSAYI